MPAVTADTLTLPRVAAPDPAVASPRPVRSVTTAPSGFEGEGFPVRRAFAGVPQSVLDPFIHMDQMGEVEYAPGEPKGTPWHPHRGFETVTYIIDGIFEHQDSNGGGGTITNGDTQWMTAGSGMLHIEKPPEHLVVSGGLFHGIQLWVNLPRAHKFHPPRYQDIRGREAALLTSADGGALLRVIAGELAGHAGPGRHVHPDHDGARDRQPGRPAGAAVESRTSTPSSTCWPARAPSGAERRPVRTGQLAVFGPGGSLTLAADTAQPQAEPNLEVLLLGGQPIREPVAHYGPFVMNTRAEIVQAMEDYQAGRLGVIPAERVPHTDEPSPR